MIARIARIVRNVARKLHANIAVPHTGIDQSPPKNLLTVVFLSDPEIHNSNSKKNIHFRLEYEINIFGFWRKTAENNDRRHVGSDSERRFKPILLESLILFFTTKKFEIYIDFDKTH